MSLIITSPEIQLGDQKTQVNIESFYPKSICLSQNIYCIGGKSKFVMLKQIDKYIVSEDKWVEIRT